MDSGTEVFGERGYSAATMTEIAARAGASIGSLYQFFPTKKVLADALLKRYGERMVAALDAVVASAEVASLQAISDGLISVMTDLNADRAAALAPDGHLKTGHLWPPQNGPVFAADFRRLA